MKVEFGGVVEHQDRPCSARQPLLSGMKVTAEDRGLAHPLVGKEPIGGLGACPILAGPWNTLTNAARELPKQLFKSFREPLVLKLTPGKFLINPSLARPP